MLNFNFHRPTDFYFGKGQENNAGEICKKYGATKVLIHFGGGSAVKSGLIDRVSNSLKNAGVDFGYATWGSVSNDGIDNPTYVFNHPLDLLKLL